MSQIKLKYWAFSFCCLKMTVLRPTAHERSEETSSTTKKLLPSNTILAVVSWQQYLKLQFRVHTKIILFAWVLFNMKPSNEEPPQTSTSGDCSALHFCIYQTLAKFAEELGFCCIEFSNKVLQQVSGNPRCKFNPHGIFSGIKMRIEGTSMSTVKDIAKANMTVEGSSFFVPHQPMNNLPERASPPAQTCTPIENVQLGKWQIEQFLPWWNLPTGIQQIGGKTTPLFFDTFTHWFNWLV